MWALIASFLAGVVLTVVVMLALRRLPNRSAGARPAPRRVAEKDARIEESITAFGEELEALVFDPVAPGHTQAMVADYRAALDAYDQAKAVPGGRSNSEARVAAALGKGHAALIRLDARLNHRPVPIEAIEQDLAPAPDVRVTGDRFTSSGKSPGVFEILLDRPERGELVIADITYRGDSNFFVYPVVRTQAKFETGQTLVNAQRSYRGRLLVDPTVTHLKIEIRGDKCYWSVRLLPTSAALPFAGELHGRNIDEVIAYDGKATTVTIQVRTEGVWRLAYERPGQWGGNDWIHGLGDGMKQLNVPRPGLLVLHMSDGGSWSVQKPA